MKIKNWQVADEIKRDFCKYLVSSDVANDVWYYQCITFLPVLSRYPTPRFICLNSDNKRRINNQKVQVSDQIKRDICKYLVSSDVADDAWYNYV